MGLVGGGLNDCLSGMGGDCRDAWLLSPGGDIKSGLIINVDFLFGVTSDCIVVGVDDNIGDGSVLFLFCIVCDRVLYVFGRVIGLFKSSKSCLPCCIFCSLFLSSMGVDDINGVLFGFSIVGCCIVIWFRGSVSILLCECASVGVLLLLNVTSLSLVSGILC